MMSPLRYAVVTFVGMILVQAAWILAIPPYHAIDEFDHAYRAAGVATGQWILTEQTPNGRGLSVAVPPGMVEVAEGQCDALPYTQPGNCHPVDVLDDGRVVVATSAGAYNPIYYLLIGAPAKPFDGAASSYVMRSVSAIVCASAVALSALLLGLMGAGQWTRLGLVVTLTPMLMYTTAVPAPNSIEIVAALVCWCALLALSRGQLQVTVERRLVWAAGISATVMVVPRTLGPMWLALMGLVLVIFVGRDRLGQVIGHHRKAVVTCVTMVLLATVASGLWSGYAGLFAESPDVGNPADSVSPVDALYPVLWMLQIVAAFPFRNNPAPVPVYAFYALALLPFFVLGIKRAIRRERIAVLLALALTLLVPVVMTLMTARSQGPIWQGRYELPLVVGTLLMCGIAMDRSAMPARVSTLCVWATGLLVGAAHVWSVVRVAEFEASRNLPSTSATVPLPVWGIATVVAAGVALLAFAAAVRPHAHSVSEPLSETSRVR